jgi:hypothetical protein
MDDGAAEATLGGVVCWFDAGYGRECPERGPDFEEVVGERPVVPRFRALGRCLLEQRAQLALERGDVAFELGPVSVLLELVPML